MQTCDAPSYSSTNFEQCRPTNKIDLIPLTAKHFLETSHAYVFDVPTELDAGTSADTLMNKFW